MGKSKNRPSEGIFEHLREKTLGGTNTILRRVLQSPDSCQGSFQVANPNLKSLSVEQEVFGALSSESKPSDWKPLLNKRPNAVLPVGLAPLEHQSKEHSGSNYPETNGFCLDTR